MNGFYNGLHEQTIYPDRWHIRRDIFISRIYFLKFGKCKIVAKSIQGTLTLPGAVAIMDYSPYCALRRAAFACGFASVYWIHRRYTALQVFMHKYVHFFTDTLLCDYCVLYGKRFYCHIQRRSKATMQKGGDSYAGYKPGKHRCTAARQRHAKHAAAGKGRRRTHRNRAANARALSAVKADLYGYMRSVLPAALRRAERIQQCIFLL